MESSLIGGPSLCYPTQNKLFATALLANHIKAVINKLVDKQQTGVKYCWPAGHHRELVNVQEGPRINMDNQEQVMFLN